MCCSVLKVAEDRKESKDKRMAHEHMNRNPQEKPKLARAQDEKLDSVILLLWKLQYKPGQGMQMQVSGL
jgi:hypothetical protein